MTYRIVYYNDKYHIVKPTDVPVKGGFATRTMAKLYIKEVLCGSITK